MRPKLSEADIQRTCTEFLELDGWRHLRTDPVSDRRRGKGFGEIGMADDLFIRYWKGCIDQTVLKPPYESWGQILWIEWKKLRALPMRHQTAWHERERVRGALTLIAGRDFPATIEGFIEWYRASGFARSVR